MKLAYPFGERRASALLKASCEDFIVDEDLGFAPSGEGEHLFVHAEKRDLNTRDLISAIARDNDIDPRQISHSGLKDRRAVARQWLSVHLPGATTTALRQRGEGYRLLEQTRHRSKLRPGTHRGNRFQVRLRECEGFDSDCEARIEQLHARGFANYFGRQRFGKDDNIEQALRLLGRRKLSRARQGLLISALRSELFNRILSRRIERGLWQTPLDGDVFMLRGSRSFFTAGLDADLRRRHEEGDISPCGSLYGRGDGLLTGTPAALEAEIFAENPEMVARLERVGARLQMRPLRVLPLELDVRFDASGRDCEIQVWLPAGSYLTALLEHFVATREPDQEARR